MIGSRKGIALLMVLWIITILMVLIVSFSLLTRTEASSTVFFRERTQKKFHAEAGIERAVMEICHRRAHRNEAATIDGDEVVRSDGRTYSGRIGPGSYAFRSFDESGKINLNRLTDLTGIVFSNLLTNLGVPKEDAAVIVDSLLDWTDGDNLHRIHGAEDEYYMSLSNPYKARNAPLVTVEELLLVRGMTPDILFGTRERKGIIRFVTIYGESPKINVNVAPMEVLLALPGMTEHAARLIVERRGENDIKTVEEIQGVAGINAKMISQFADVVESSIYTVEAVGFDEKAKNGYGIRAVVSVGVAGASRFFYYKSPAEMRQ